jgi:hypothetical protein
MVTRVPVSLGTMRGFSVKVGGKPSTVVFAASAGFGTAASAGSAALAGAAWSSPAYKNTDSSEMYSLVWLRMDWHIKSPKTTSTFLVKIGGFLERENVRGLTDVHKVLTNVFPPQIFNSIRR